MSVLLHRLDPSAIKMYRVRVRVKLRIRIRIRVELRIRPRPRLRADIANTPGRNTAHGTMMATARGPTISHHQESMVQRMVHMVHTMMESMVHHQESMVQRRDRARGPSAHGSWAALIGTWQLGCTHRHMAVRLQAP